MDHVVYVSEESLRKVLGSDVETRGARVANLDAGGCDEARTPCGFGSVDRSSRPGSDPKGDPVCLQFLVQSPFGLGLQQQLV